MSFQVLIRQVLIKQVLIRQVLIGHHRNVAKEMFARR